MRPKTNPGRQNFLMGQTVMEETAPMYNAIYGDRTWEQITLGELINKGGAAGRIFRVKAIRRWWQNFP